MCHNFIEYDSEEINLDSDNSPMENIQTQKKRKVSQYKSDKVANSGGKIRTSGLQKL